MDLLELSWHTVNTDLVLVADVTNTNSDIKIDLSECLQEYLRFLPVGGHSKHHWEIEWEACTTAEGYREVLEKLLEHEGFIANRLKDVFDLLTDAASLENLKTSRPSTPDNEHSSSRQLIRLACGSVEDNAGPNARYLKSLIVTLKIPSHKRKRSMNFQCGATNRQLRDTSLPPTKRFRMGNSQLRTNVPQIPEKGTRSLPLPIDTPNAVSSVDRTATVLPLVLSSIHGAVRSIKRLHTWHHSYLKTLHGQVVAIAKTERLLESYLSQASLGSRRAVTVDNLRRKKSQLQMEAINLTKVIDSLVEQMRWELEVYNWSVANMRDNTKKWDYVNGDDNSHGSRKVWLAAENEQYWKVLEKGNMWTWVNSVRMLSRWNTAQRR